MPSTYTPLLRLELQATGENQSTWGIKANNVFSLIEAAISGVVSIGMANANVTLTSVNGATDQSRNMAVSLTGANSAVRTVTVPNTSKVYFIQNATTGGFAINVKTSSSNTITVANGQWSIVMVQNGVVTKTYDFGFGTSTAYDIGTSGDTVPLLSGANTWTTTQTMPILRLTSTGDASPTSTTHALQIGPTTSANVIFDTNEILTRVNGANGGELVISNGVNLTSTPLSIASGGTGAGDAATARTNLGTNNAANLTTGYVPVARVPHMSGPDADGNAFISTRRDGSLTAPCADIGVSGGIYNFYYRVDGTTVFRVDTTGEIVVGLMNANKLSGTLSNSQLAGNYSFTGLTLSGGLSVNSGGSPQGAGTINFANNDTLSYDDTTNTWTFAADGSASPSGIIQAGAFEGPTGDRAVFAARTLTAGNGLTGGGDLTANRTFTLGTPGTLTGSTTNAVTTTSHTHAISLSAADVGAASSAISITAGNGLSGGGTLAASRTLTLGTPGSLTSTTTNAVTTTSHTHDVDVASIASAGSAALAVGSIGSDAFLWNTVSETVSPGTTRAGSTLEYSNANGQTSGTSPAGTWRCMGYCFTGSGSPRSTLWRRIS